jgi:hypothetical protein
MLRKFFYKNSIISLFSLLLFVLFSNNSSAQNILTGRIFEYQTHTGIAGVKVENLKSHVTAVSTAEGKYAIKAAKGDLICYSRSSYKSDTILVANLKYKEVFLELSENLLKEVKIINKETNMGIVATPVTTTPFGGNTVHYQTDASGNNRGGLQLSLTGSNKAQQNRVKEAKLEADDKTSTKIAQVFSPENLQNFIPIKGQELENFIILYRPPLNVYRAKFNLTLYVDSCYKEFVKIPADKRQSKTFLDLNSKP